MQGHEVPQTGTPPATTKSHGQVPSSNGHRVPQTREAHSTHRTPEQEKVPNKSDPPTGRSGRKDARPVGRAGPPARTPHPLPMGSGPRPPAPRTGGRGKESARPDTPLTQARGAPRRAPYCRPGQRTEPARKSARCGVGDGSPSPQPPHLRITSSGPEPPAPRTGGLGRESARPRTALTQARGMPPRAPSCRPHRAQS